MCVCVCVCLFMYKRVYVKDFSGTTAPRILKFGTIVRYDLLYCVKENQPPPLLSPLFIHFSFSPIKLSIIEFSIPMRARVFILCMHLEKGQVYCGKEIQDAVINVCLLVFLSHSSVIQRDICVKDSNIT